MENELHRFWIEFDDADTFVPGGFGVTAATYAEALTMIHAHIKGMKPKRRIPLKAKITPDVDVAELQKRLPKSRFGIPCNRGIWYPRENIGSVYPPTP